jgi:threonyl-tRNA synthetase
VQVAVVPVADDHAGYARHVADTLAAVGVRVEIEEATETLGNRIRKVQTSKVPYALVVGGDEAEAGTVAIRPYDGDQRKQVPLAEFVAEVVAEIAARHA